jgi:hypothetical protein
MIPPPVAGTLRKIDSRDSKMLNGLSYHPFPNPPPLRGRGGWGVSFVNP